MWVSRVVGLPERDLPVELRSFPTWLEETHEPYCTPALVSGQMRLKFPEFLGSQALAISVTGLVPDYVAQIGILVLLKLLHPLRA